MNINQLTLYCSTGTAALALIYSYFLIQKVLALPAGSKKLQEIAAAVSTGASAYLKRQFNIVIPLIFALALALLIFASPGLAVTFLMGALFSAAIGYTGMWIAVRANVRTAHAAQKGLEPAMNVSFGAGAVNGMLVVGLGLLGVSLIYWWAYQTYVPLGPAAITQHLDSVLVGYAFGAALLALFMRVGGGIFTKAADVGADLVGKVEAGIPEDDPRNPATIADNVGDNVGDCAGMAADVFESYSITLVAAMLLGSGAAGLAGVTFPLLLSAAAVLVSIFGTTLVKVKNDRVAPISPLINAFMISAVLTILVIYLLATVVFNQPVYGFAAITGTVAMLVLLFITKYYTGPGEKPVVEIASASQTGAGTNLITGLALGMESTFVSAVLIAATIFVAFLLAGFYGIALAGLGMLATTGMIMSLDTFGPISDNAQGMVEMGGLTGKAAKITDALDAVGNTTKALTKGFAVGSAAVAASSLFATYFATTGLTAINIANPVVFIGLILGAALPFLFSSRLIGSVGRAAFEIVTEVRRQFKEMKGIMTGKTKPDYTRAVDIVTAAAQRELLFPAALVIFLPILVSFLGTEALGGYLGGVVAVGLMMALFMANTGGAWDNAKKYIEDGHFGGKKSEPHKAAVVGDTVGDPLKDTSGPALNPMMKITQIVALLIVPIILNLIGR